MMKLDSVTWTIDDAVHPWDENLDDGVTMKIKKKSFGIPTDCISES